MQPIFLGRTVATDIIVGITMMLLSLACGVAYSLILHVSFTLK